MSRKQSAEAGSSEPTDSIRVKKFIYFNVPFNTPVGCKYSFDSNRSITLITKHPLHHYLKFPFTRRLSFHRSRRLVFPSIPPL